MSIILIRSDSDNKSDIYTHNLAGPPATMFNPEFNDDAYNIPINIPETDSPEDSDSYGTTMRNALAFGQDLVTSLYTAALFAHLHEDLLE